MQATSLTTTAVYTYNGDGLRVAQAIDGVETAFTWDQALELPQLLATSDGTRYLHGLGLAGVHTTGQWYYPHTDALGSIRRWSDAGGTVVGELAYDPYGGITQQQGVIPSPLDFAGEWTDAATGLQYLRARWYDPATGRFTQVDPFPGLLSLPGTQHPYVYGLNNPLRYTDPSGEFVQILGGAAAGAAIGAVGGGVSYALRHPGKSLAEYVRDTEFRKAVGIGAASGAVFGAVAAAVPLGFAALGLKAATAGGAAFIGWVSGSLAGGAGQITANLLTPCTRWHQGVSRAMFWGGLGGAVFGWAGWHVRQWWAARQYPQIKNGSAGGPTAGKRFPESVRDQAFAENPTQTCVYCRRSGTATHVDHAIPRSQGGNATFENAQLTCPWCNQSKGAGSFPVNPPPAYKGPWPPAWWNQ